MFQRLMAIPQEEYLQLTSVQQARQPITQQFYDLEKRYQEGEHITEPYKRLLNQSETLNEMKNLKEKMRQGIITSTPKPYQTRAKSLFQSLEPFIKYNDRGEIYDEKSNIIPESRLEDLIQYAVRDRRRNIIPKAWSEFVTLLKKHNVPKSMLNHDTLREIDLPKEHTFMKSEPITPTSRRASPKKHERGAKLSALHDIFMQGNSMMKKRKKKIIPSTSVVKLLKDFRQ